MRNINALDELIASTPLPYKDDYVGRVVAFVHAKGNSTRVVSKNMRMLGDLPLFCHAIKTAKEAKLVDAVIIDSDDDVILRIGVEHGALPMKRPAELATNFATGDDLAYWQASNVPKSAICIQVIPTAPFLKAASVDGAIRMLLDDLTLDSVAGCFAESLYTWTDGKPDYYREDGTIPNSFDLEKTVYETTGMYANRTEAILRTRKRLNPDSSKPFILSRIETIDINTVEDFEFAEIVQRGMGGYSTDA